MKKFSYFLFFLFLVVLGVTFTIQNPQDISVQYYLGLTWRGPLVILVVASLGIGIVIGSLVGLAKNFRLKRRISRLAKEKYETKGSNNHSRVAPDPKN